jgi:hypothetical protein
MLDSLTEAQTFALSALLEVESPTSVGAFVSETDEGDSVVSYRFATTLEGYPGWNWTIAIAHLPGEEPSVIESELLPANGALLAPDWVPWSDRMEDYRAAQIALGEAASDSDEDDEDDDDDDEDALGSDNLHGGDLDGVDIDEIAEALDESGEDSDEDVMDDDEVVEFEIVESGAFDLQVDEGDQSETQGDSGSEDPPRVAGRRNRASKKQQDNQGD